MSVVRYRILAWLGQTETDRLEAENVAAYLGLQAEQAAGVGSPGDGELHTPPGGGSPRPLRLSAIRDIRRAG